MLHKKNLVIISLAFVCQLSFASTCPSISDIKNNTLSGWKAYDSDEHKPLSLARETAFKQHAQEFALAEWVNHHKTGNTIHCYYRDASGSNMEAYFSKDHLTPKNAKNYWYEVSGFMQCAAGANNCEFERIKNPQTRLAKK